MGELEQAIFEKARSGDYRYLLARSAERLKSDEWLACKSLVDSGHAKWMTYSNMAPGIILTGKPLDAPTIPTHSLGKGGS